MFDHHQQWSGNKRIFPFRCYVNCNRTLHCLCYWSLRVRASTDPLPVAFHHKRMSSIRRNRLNNLHSHYMCGDPAPALSSTHTRGPKIPPVYSLYSVAIADQFISLQAKCSEALSRERVSPTHILKNSRRRLARYSLTRKREGSNIKCWTM